MKENKYCYKQTFFNFEETFERPKKNEKFYNILLEIEDLSCDDFNKRFDKNTIGEIKNFIETKKIVLREVIKKEYWQYLGLN